MRVEPTRLTLLAVAVLASSTRAQVVRSDTVTFAAVSVGGIHTCGVAAGGVAYCWGWNTRGQLGDGTSGTERWVPVRVVGDARFAAVSAGDRYTCGLTTTGAAYCWGLNGWGQLGDGTTTDRSSPVLVAGVLNFKLVATGFRQTCAIAVSGAAYCWGLNRAGQLGDGTTTDRSSPARVAGDLTFSAVSAGDFHTCGVTTAGAAYCWGANGDGQLGDGSTTNRSTPTPVRVVSGVTFAAVSAGGFHTCGITPDGAAYCWGANGEGQLGDASADGRTQPVRVAGGGSYAAVSAGNSHTCAITAVGAAYCWGLNVQGQLGDGTTESRRRPVPVAGDIHFVAIEAGGSGQALGFHSCGLTVAGAAYCWGQNARGQLGDGTTQDQTRPVPVAQNRAGAAIPPPLEGEAAYVDAMEADLRNLVLAEEMFFADSVKYSSKIGPGAVDLRLSEGSTLLSLQLTQDGWTARMGHAYTQTVCTMFVGSTPLPPATKEGVATCK
ncbi:MAG: chromosome condensation regulator RCC1 [Gemmatimonadetes bacterium]|nr:MAG: chromosome condensation regulator RCC1 [Gemmatimonadota bacterium]